MAEPPRAVQALRSGATVLTASDRAARGLTQAYHKTFAGQPSWTPASVFPVDRWLASRWHQLVIHGYETRLLLNDTQEHSIWRAIIAADSRSRAGGEVNQGPGQSPDALAKLAAGAWRELALGNGLDRLEECGVSTDGKAFVRWAQEFERRCTKRDLLPAAGLAAALTEALTANSRSAPEGPDILAEPILAEPIALIPEAGLELLDFDSLAPALEKLFTAINRAGHPVVRTRTAVEVTSGGLLEAQNDQDELRACAHWVLSQMERNPDSRLAVVVPQIAGRRAAIRRVFDQLLPTRDGWPLYEFSLGEPLSRTGLVKTALDLLRWTFEPLQLPAIGSLLLSPLLTGAGATSVETLAAAEFDAFKLRQSHLLRPELTLRECIEVIGGWNRRTEIASLFRSLMRVEKAAAQAGERQTWTAWAEHFRSLLEAAGLPDWVNSSNAPEDHQVLRRWESALDEMSTNDFEGGLVTGPEALASVERIACQAIFATASRGAPVQVMGPLEVGGAAFDGLWFLGADDLSWPVPHAIQPLLPWRLQRALGLRGADRQRDLAIAQALTARVASSAAEVVFSYAKHAADSERRKSSLLRLLNLKPIPQPADTLHVPFAFDQFHDETPLPVPGATNGGVSDPADEDGPVILGGARVLELEAACSFRAFAELRVWSSAIDSREPGFDDRERGVVVHKTMEEFWKRLADQQALLALPLAERDAILDVCIAQALERASRGARSAWDHAYLEVQRQRLRHLLRPWLDLEAKRPPFAVFQQETSLEGAQLGPLSFKRLRIDRIDETVGGRLVIDYKTGKAEPRDWRGHRPELPQLPLYAVLLNDQRAKAVGPDDTADPETAIGGVAFALLRPNDGLALKGMADDPRVLAVGSSIEEPTLDEQIATWRQILTNLAEQFASGVAAVEPRRYPETCKYCEQRLFCRVDPNQLNPLATDVEDESGEIAAAALEGDNNADEARLAPEADLE